jgi:N-carbamoyl-L-amino-acid hydrolase
MIDDLVIDDRRRAAFDVGAATARRLFDALEERTADPPGITRIAYGEGERIAHDLVAGAARDWGGAIDHDPAGNQFITMPGRDRERTILIGSHMDTVPHGGNFDGAAGIVLGLAVQAALAAEGKTPPFDLQVVCLRAEESCWFPHSYIGSKTALGRLDPAVLDDVRRSDSDRSLAEHMREEGFDPQSVRAGRCLIDPARIIAFLEPHIEQGPVLVAENVPIGLVSAIRGSFRHRQARCLGQYAHSGATPSGLRRDAVVATASLVLAVQEVWADLEAEGHDVAVTFGQIGTDPAQHSFSKVAGEVNFCLDVRSQSKETLEIVRTRVDALSAEIAARHNVQFDFGPISGSDPALMSEGVLNLIEGVAGRIGLTTLTMASGAGHDAATFSSAGIPSGMIFIRNEHGSHNPDEGMDMSDFDRALVLLLGLMDEPAEAWSAAVAGAVQ